MQAAPGMLPWPSDCQRNLASAFLRFPEADTTQIHTVPKLGKVLFPRLHCSFKRWHLERQGHFHPCLWERKHVVLPCVDADVWASSSRTRVSGSLGFRVESSHVPVSLLYVSPQPRSLSNFVSDSGRPTKSPWNLSQLCKVLSHALIFSFGSHRNLAKRCSTHLSHLQKRQGGLRVLSQGIRIIFTFSESSCSGLRAVMLLWMISWALDGNLQNQEQSCSLLITAAAGKPILLWHKSRRPSTSGWVSQAAVWNYIQQWGVIIVSEARLGCRGLCGFLIPTPPVVSYSSILDTCHNAWRWLL